MGDEPNALIEAARAFSEEPGIRVNDRGIGHMDRVLVKVMDEDAIGRFFQICREYDVERSETTRGDLSVTELDSWVSEE